MSSPEMYDGQEERRDPAARARFDAAVRQAARDAAQQVAQISRRRQVRQSIIGSIVGICLVAGIAWFAIRDAEKSFARANAIYDCQLFTRAATAVGDFVNSDANLRQRLDLQANGRNRLTAEVLADFSKIINPRTLQRLLARQRTAEQQTLTGWRRDANTLTTLGGTDCIAHLGG
jgi:hypothetical protein